MAVNLAQADSEVCTQQLLVRHLLIWMRDNILTERPELFMKDASVCGCTLVSALWSLSAASELASFCRRPGILVLINEVDWELWCALWHEMLLLACKVGH